MRMLNRFEAKFFIYNSEFTDLTSTFANVNEIIEISKALSNKTRVQILQWLKEPENHFPPHTEVSGFEQGVCLVYIKEKSKLSQSTISQYMAQLESTGLVTATRIGKWTYFKRNEDAILSFAKQIQSL